MFTGPSDQQSLLQPTQHRFCIHGVPVELECAVPELRREIRATFGVFALHDPDSFSPCVGTIVPYEEAEVVRRLSSSATLVSRTAELAEIYRDGERFWLVDDRWGVCELNLLKNVWRSWVISTPQIDAFRCMEMAVMWPLAHLLRGRGVHLAPAASASHHGSGVLLISPFVLEPELCAMRDAGYQLIGQRWTVLRGEENEISLLKIPGGIERQLTRQTPANPTDASPWRDLTEGRPGTENHRAICRSILIVRHGRRATARLHEIEGTAAVKLLRRSWPVPELCSQRRVAPLASRLGQICRCWDVQLSRDPQEFLALFHAARDGTRVVAA